MISDNDKHIIKGFAIELSGETTELDELISEYSLHCEDEELEEYLREDFAMDKCSSCGTWYDDTELDENNDCHDCS